MCLCSIMFLSLEGKAQVKPIIKDSLSITTIKFSKISIEDPAINKPAYKYVYTVPTNELMRWSNYPLTSAQIEQRQKVEEHRKVLPAIAESIVESYLNNRKKKKAAVVPAF